MVPPIESSLVTEVVKIVAKLQHWSTKATEVTLKCFALFSPLQIYPY